MTRLKTTLAAALALLAFSPDLRAQLSTVVVVDFEQAIVESAEGKKATEKFNAEMKALQTEMTKKQTELEDQQKKLQNGARTLADAAKAELQKDIDRRTRELQRMDEDAQRELQSLRDELLRPIAEPASAVLNALAAEKGYTMVIDLSNPDTNVIWYNPNNDITQEVIKRLDALTQRAAPAAPAETTKPAPPAK